MTVTTTRWRRQRVEHDAQRVEQDAQRVEHDGLVKLVAPKRAEQ